MNKQTETALKMAIEAMQSAYSSHGKILPSYPAQDAWMFHGCDEKLSKALQACKEALEQPEQEYLTRAQQVIRANNSAQEPVAWVSEVTLENIEWVRKQDTDNCLEIFCCCDEWDDNNIALYTHPAPSWQGLSDDEIEAIIYDKMGVLPTPFERKVAEAIEQALRSKNENT